MMRNIPKSFRKYMKVIGEIDEMSPQDEAKYDVILAAGYSFTDDPMRDGNNGHECSSWHTWATVREGLRELRGVVKCDCAACKKAGNWCHR